MTGGSDVHPLLRVALSDDYEIALLGLAQMLARHQDRVQIVDLTTDPRVQHEPDIILYDTSGRLPERDAKLRRVVAENTAKLVVYSSEYYPEESARRQGAAAYLHKGLDAETLVDALLAIHRGDDVPAATDDRAAEAGVVTWPGQDLGLSQRESEMLSFIVRGVSNEDIAQRSFLSINTVKSHIRTAYRKIGAQSRTQAVIWGFRNGFASTDDTGV